MVKSQFLPGFNSDPTLRQPEGRVDPKVVGRSSRQALTPPFTNVPGNGHSVRQQNPQTTQRLTLY